MRAKKSAGVTVRAKLFFVITLSNDDIKKSLISQRIGIKLLSNSYKECYTLKVMVIKFHF